MFEECSEENGFARNGEEGMLMGDLCETTG
jgi:hypothetical protein